MDWPGLFALGIVVGAALGLLLGPLARYVRARLRRTPHPLGDPTVEVLTLPAEVPPAIEFTNRTETLGPAPVPADLPPWGSESGGASAAARTPSVETVTLSRRIVLHLFERGRLGPDDVGSPEATQRGIGVVLSAEQSAISKVVRRLIAAGIVEVGRRHVRGWDRRVNVYTLTRRGELLAHELRSRATVTPSSSGSADPYGRRPTSVHRLEQVPRG